MFDWGAVGGLLLIIGAFSLYRGNVHLSIILYFLADACWLALSFQTGNILGSVMIAIGMILGVGVYMKMNRGEFHKNLNVKTKEEE